MEELLLQSRVGCSTVQEQCSGPIRAVSFPDDKRYAEGKNPTPPDSLAEVGVTLVSSEVLLL